MRPSLLLAGLLLIFFGSGAAAEQGPEGAELFNTYCSVCHSMGSGDRVGPDLAGVTQRRDADWLRRMISVPDELIAEGDPVVTALVERYNRIVMPNLELDAKSTSALLEYLTAVDAGGIDARPTASPESYDLPALAAPQARIWQVFLLISVVIVLVFSMVAFSTRQPREVNTARAYGFRRVLFLAALVAVIGVLATTLPDAPYAAQRTMADPDVDRIVYVTARQFEFIWTDEPVTGIEDVGRVPRLAELELDAGSTVEFRVFSLDVNHGFGLYSPERQLVAQTQAMPGYVNRLRVRLDEPGRYIVLCLEYCATGHHRMRTSLKVR